MSLVGNNYYWQTWQMEIFRNNSDPVREYFPNAHTVIDMDLLRYCLRPFFGHRVD